MKLLNPNRQLRKNPDTASCIFRRQIGSANTDLHRFIAADIPATPWLIDSARDMLFVLCPGGSPRRSLKLSISANVFVLFLALENATSDRAAVVKANRRFIMSRFYLIAHRIPETRDPFVFCFSRDAVTHRDETIPAMRVSFIPHV